MKLNKHDVGHMTKRAVMSLYGINPLKYFQEPVISGKI